MLYPGDILQGRYRIVSLLGQGGMGDVYRAYDMRLRVPVALKEMVPQPGIDPKELTQLRAQFEQEAFVLARLNHPNLVDVTDFFEERGNVYLVMKFVEGESLDDHIGREGAIAEDQVLEWADQLLGALAYCHDQGIIHRDIKPQNVVIQPDGQAVLVDFGLVKLWDSADPRTRTAIRGAGTPEYAPPEQYSSQPGHTGPHSDIYSLGATIYHALTGQSPPSATDRIVDPSSLVRPRVLAPRVSGGTEDAVLKAMALQPVQRFTSAREMAAALGRDGGPPLPAKVAPSQVPARPSPTKVLPSPRPQRGLAPGWAWAAGGVLLLALLICTGVTLGPQLWEAAFVEPIPTSTVHPTYTPEPPAVTIQTRTTDGMVMVYIPGGTFQMGSAESDPDAYGGEFPQHTVTLDPFWIDQTEVTNAQYAPCVADGECNASAYADDTSYNGDNYPVVGVSWSDAVAYCEWAGARLPTEAEWEYAARGGQKSQGYLYAGSDNPDDVAWYVGNSGGQAHPVAQKAPNELGLYDMSGNVWEWVADWYGDYPSAPQANPTGPATGDYRVLRGGSWRNDESRARSAFRGGYGLYYRHYHSYGFRCGGDSPGR